jgi:hypothetical protein
LDLGATYTWSKSLDDVSFDSSTLGVAPSLVNLGGSPATGFQGGGNQFVPRPLRSDRGPSDFDLRHNLTISHVVELPFGAGRRFGTGATGWLQNVIGGWSLSGLAILRSGQPFSITHGTDFADDGDSALNNRPAFIKGGSSDLYATGDHDKPQYLVTQAQANTMLGIPANVADPFASVTRNSMRSAPVYNYDVSLLKQFTLREHMNLAFELNAFNVFNRAHMGVPIAALTNTRFGQVTSTALGTNPRQLQLGLKLTF